MICIDIGGISVLLMLIEFWLFVYLVSLLNCVFICSELVSVCLFDGDVLECIVDSYISWLCKKFECVGVFGMLDVMCGVGY